MKLRPKTSTPQRTSINLAYDIETDGLDCDNIHCIVTQDLDTGLVTEYNDQATPNYSVVNAVNDLETAHNIISHNGLCLTYHRLKSITHFLRVKLNTGTHLSSVDSTTQTY